MIEPKDCPFCKNECVEIYLEEGYYSGLRYSNVYCGTCGAEGPHIGLDSFDSEEYDGVDEKEFLFEKAVKAWNREE